MASERKQGKRSRPGVEVQRQRILDEARGAIARDGLDGINVSSLCSALDLSRPTFYRCFESLEHLIEALQLQFHESVEQRLSVQLQSADVEGTWLDAMVKQVIEDAAAMGPLLVELSREELRIHSPAAALRDARIEAHLSVINRARKARGLKRHSQDMLRSIVLLLQVWGIEVARTQPSKRRRARIIKTLVVMIRVTLEAFEAENY